MTELHRTVLIDKNGVRRTYYVRQSPVARGYRYSKAKGGFVAGKVRPRRKVARSKAEKHVIVVYGSDYDRESGERVEVEWRVTVVGNDQDLATAKATIEDWWTQTQGHYESKGKKEGRRWVVPEHKVGVESEGRGRLGVGLKRVERTLVSDRKPEPEHDARLYGKLRAALE